MQDISTEPYIKIYDMKEVQEILHVKPTTLFRMVREGEIESFKIRNKKRMFTSQAVDAYIQKQVELATEV